MSVGWSDDHSLVDMVEKVYETSNFHGVCVRFRLGGRELGVQRFPENPLYNFSSNNQSFVLMMENNGEKKPQTQKEKA